MFDILSVPSPGGDDHHRGVHSGCVCVPHELQPQEPGTTGEPRGWDRVNLYHVSYIIYNSYHVVGNINLFALHCGDLTQNASPSNVNH